MDQRRRSSGNGNSGYTRHTVFKETTESQRRRSSDQTDENQRRRSSGASEEHQRRRSSGASDEHQRRRSSGASDERHRRRSSGATEEPHHRRNSESPAESAPDAFTSQRRSFGSARNSIEYAPRRSFGSSGGHTRRSYGERYSYNSGRNSSPPIAQVNVTQGPPAFSEPRGSNWRDSDQTPGSEGRGSISGKQRWFFLWPEPNQERQTDVREREEHGEEAMAEVSQTPTVQLLNIHTDELCNDGERTSGKTEQYIAISDVSKLKKTSIRKLVDLRELERVNELSLAPLCQATNRPQLETVIPNKKPETPPQPKPESKTLKPDSPKSAVLPQNFELEIEIEMDGCENDKPTYSYEVNAPTDNTGESSLAAQGTCAPIQATVCFIPNLMMGTCAPPPVCSPYTPTQVSQPQQNAALAGNWAPPQQQTTSPPPPVQNNSQPPQQSTSSPPQPQQLQQQQQVSTPSPPAADSCLTNPGEYWMQYGNPPGTWGTCPEPSAPAQSQQPSQPSQIPATAYANTQFQPTTNNTATTWEPPTQTPQSQPQTVSTNANASPAGNWSPQTQAQTYSQPQTQQSRPPQQQQQQSYQNWAPQPEPSPPAQTGNWSPSYPSPQAPAQQAVSTNIMNYWPPTQQTQPQVSTYAMNPYPQQTNWVPEPPQQQQTPATAAGTSAGGNWNTSSTPPKTQQQAVSAYSINPYQAQLQPQQQQQQQQATTTTTNTGGNEPPSYTPPAKQTVSTNANASPAGNWAPQNQNQTYSQPQPQQSRPPQQQQTQANAPVSKQTTISTNVLYPQNNSKPSPPPPQQNAVATNTAGTWATTPTLVTPISTTTQQPSTNSNSAGTSTAIQYPSNTKTSTPSPAPTFSPNSVATSTATAKPESCGPPPQPQPMPRNAVCYFILDPSAAQAAGHCLPNGTAATAGKPVITNANITFPLSARPPSGPPMSMQSMSPQQANMNYNARPPGNQEMNAGPQSGVKPGTSMQQQGNIPGYNANTAPAAQQQRQGQYANQNQSAFNPRPSNQQQGQFPNQTGSFRAGPSGLQQSQNQNQSGFNPRLSGQSFGKQGPPAPGQQQQQQSQVNRPGQSPAQRVPSQQPQPFAYPELQRGPSMQQGPRPNSGPAPPPRPSSLRNSSGGGGGPLPGQQQQQQQSQPPAQNPQNQNQGPQEELCCVAPPPNRPPANQQVQQQRYNSAPPTPTIDTVQTRPPPMVTFAEPLEQGPTGAGLKKISPRQTNPFQLPTLRSILHKGRTGNNNNHNNIFPVRQHVPGPPVTSPGMFPNQGSCSSQPPPLQPGGCGGGPTMAGVIPHGCTSDPSMQQGMQMPPYYPGGVPPHGCTSNTAMQMQMSPSPFGVPPHGCTSNSSMDPNANMYGNNNNPFMYPPAQAGLYQRPTSSPGGMYQAQPPMQRPYGSPNYNTPPRTPPYQPQPRHPSPRGPSPPPLPPHSSRGSRRPQVVVVEGVGVNGTRDDFDDGRGYNNNWEPTRGYYGGSDRRPLYPGKTNTFTETDPQKATRGTEPDADRGNKPRNNNPDIYFMGGGGYYDSGRGGYLYRDSDRDGYPYRDGYPRNDSNRGKGNPDRDSDRRRSPRRGSGNEDDDSDTAPDVYIVDGGGRGPLPRETDSRYEDDDDDSRNNNRRPRPQGRAMDFSPPEEDGDDENNDDDNNNNNVNDEEDYSQDEKDDDYDEGAGARSKGGRGGNVYYGNRDLDIANLCPYCGIGVFEKRTTVTGYLTAIFCFPCGLFCCLNKRCCYIVECSHCHAVTTNVPVSKKNTDRDKDLKRKRKKLGKR